MGVKKRRAVEILLQQKHISIHSFKFIKGLENNKNIAKGKGTITCTTKFKGLIALRGHLGITFVHFRSKLLPLKILSPNKFYIYRKLIKEFFFQCKN